MLILTLTKMTDACSCAPLQYQTLYCRADAVIKGTIESKYLIYGGASLTNNDVFSSSDDSSSDSTSDVSLDNDVVPQFIPQQYPLYVVYNVTIRAIYKGENELVSKKTVSISTSASGSMCGISGLQEGETYVISGYIWDGEMNIGLCSSWVEPYKRLSSFQKKGLKHLYGKTCDDCQVCSPYYGGDCKPTEGCLSTFASSCVRKNTACVRNSKGECTWKRNKHLKAC